MSSTGYGLLEIDSRFSGRINIEYQSFYEDWNYGAAIDLFMWICYNVGEVKFRGSHACLQVKTNVVTSKLKTMEKNDILLKDFIERAVLLIVLYAELGAIVMFTYPKYPDVARIVYIAFTVSGCCILVFIFLWFYRNWKKLSEDE